MISHLLGGEIVLVRIHLFDHNLDLQTSNKYRRSIFLFSHTRGLSVLLDHHKGPSAKNRSKWAPMICTSSSNVLKIVQNEQKQCIRNYPCFYLKVLYFLEKSAQVFQLEPHHSTAQGSVKKYYLQCDSWYFYYIVVTTGEYFSLTLYHVWPEESALVPY